MQAPHPVRPPPSRLDGHLGAIGVLIVGAIAVAILKPWGSNLGTSVSGQVRSLLPSLSPSPSPSPSPKTQIGFNGLVYDPSIFGNREPEAIWGIWPAGFLTTFGFVIQVPTAASPSPASAPGQPSATAPAPSGSANPTPVRSTAGEDSGPVWPARLEMPEGDHLLLIGINMPRGYRIASAHLARYLTDGSLVAVVIEPLRSPWPAHFAVIGVPTVSGNGLLDVWPPGRYRLDLAFDPGTIESSIEILIAGPPVGP
jgi:hypothetical protein